MLWDDRQKQVINNESADIIQILNSQFDDFASNSKLDLYPAELKEMCDRWNKIIYETVNNEIGRAHVWTPVTDQSRMPSSAWKKKKQKKKKIKNKTKNDNKQVVKTE